MSLELFPIRTDEDHDRAVRLISMFWSAPEGSLEEAYMDALATLVDRFERERYPIEKSSPLEIIASVMEQSGRTQSDLAALLGSRSRASEILNGKRELTMDHIRKLHRAWHIPVALLVGELEDA